MKNSRSFELTAVAVRFLKKLFDMHKVQNSQTDVQILDLQGIEKVFATCPPAFGLPFDAVRETQFDHGLSFELWVGLWQKVFCEKPR